MLRKVLRMGVTKILKMLLPPKWVFKQTHIKVMHQRNCIYILCFALIFHSLYKALQVRYTVRVT